MSVAKRRMDLAVTLFERGFSEDRVEGAVKHCTTLSEAIAWLNGPGLKRKSDGKQSGGARTLAKRPSMHEGKSRSSTGSAHEHEGMKLKLNQKVETCAICFTEAQPTKAVRLGCRHGWYCLHCMKMHANARLNVGDVCVPCPECRAPIPDFCLKEILTDDVVSNFHTRSIKQAIACSPNLFTCPTANCDMCVELDDGEDAWLKKCPQCKKGSCLRCGAQPFHKGLTCQEHSLRSRTNEVKSAEMSLRRWMRKTGTKQCPQCNMGVTKEDLENQSTQRSECHKMLCRHCGTRFCFKCLAMLSETFSCGCSIDAHGFVNPLNGKRLGHLRGAAKAKASARKAPAKVSSGTRGKSAPPMKHFAQRGRRGGA